MILKKIKLSKKKWKSIGKQAGWIKAQVEAPASLRRHKLIIERPEEDMAKETTVFIEETGDRLYAVKASFGQLGSLSLREHTYGSFNDFASASRKMDQIVHDKIMYGYVTSPDGEYRNPIIRNLASNIKRIKISKAEWGGKGEYQSPTSDGIPQEDKELSTEELQDAWSNAEGDIKVNDRGEVFYAGKQIIDPGENGSTDFRAIARWMEENAYYPNIWVVNDHGNISLFSVDELGNETYHGGLV